MTLHDAIQKADSMPHNQLFREVWCKQEKSIDEIPADLTDEFKEWLRAKLSQYMYLSGVSQELLLNIRDKYGVDFYNYILLDAPKMKKKMDKILQENP